MESNAEKILGKYLTLNNMLAINVTPIPGGHGIYIPIESFKDLRDLIVLAMEEYYTIKNK